MKSSNVLALAGAVALVAALGASPAHAGVGRQYYDGWRNSGHGYLFSTYHYKPYAAYPTYLYNYAIYYPATPRFVYYFNPYKGTYWGRFDVKTKGYSLLAEKDRAGALKDVPEKAFPAEGPLPQVPDAKEQLTLAEPPDLPAGEKINASTAAADKTDEVTAPPAPATDDKTPPAPATTDKPAPATPAEKPAAGAPAGTPAATGTPAPGGTPAPAGGPATGETPAPAVTGTGVAAPAEPINPAPAGGPATGGPATGGPATTGAVTGGPTGATPVTGVAAPVTGVAAPVNGPVFPGFSGNCYHKFGGCPTHGRR
jgi:hypothetical protein